MSEVIHSIEQWRTLTETLKQKGKRLGLVPTMGALHQGHISLVERSRAENDITLVSVFVNPTQFNNADDFNNYPQTFEQDRNLLAGQNVDYILFPKAEEMYADQYNFQLTEKNMSPLLCGQHRPGHFAGVLTVVLKLLNISHAQRAYFGEKDYQQLLLIRSLAQALFVDTEIIGLPTVREPDGLAMSSRNQRLSEPNRTLAPKIFELLNSQQTCSEIHKALTNLGFRVDYVEEHWGRRFAAAWLEDVRLIDNVAI